MVEVLEKILFIGVCTSTSSLGSDLLWNLIERKEIRSMGADTVDMWICLEVGKLVHTQEYETIYVVSRDNFAGTLEIVANKDFGAHVLRFGTIGSMIKTLQ